MLFSLRSTNRAAAVLHDRRGSADPPRSLSAQPLETFGRNFYVQAFDMAPKRLGGGVGNMNPSETSRESLSTAFLNLRGTKLSQGHIHRTDSCQSVRFSS